MMKDAAVTDPRLEHRWHAAIDWKIRSCRSKGRTWRQHQSLSPIDRSLEAKNYNKLISCLSTYELLAVSIEPLSEELATGE